MYIGEKMIKDEQAYYALVEQLKNTWRARDSYARGTSQWDSFESQAIAITNQMSNLNPNLDHKELQAMYQFM